TRMRSRKIATARPCRRDRACVYPAIRDGWRTHRSGPSAQRGGGTTARYKVGGWAIGGSHARTSASPHEGGFGGALLRVSPSTDFQKNCALNSDFRDLDIRAAA